MTEILKLSGSIEKTKDTNLKEGIPFCSVCKNQNKHIESSEKCIQCNHLNHKKCAAMSQDKLNTDTEYLCTECLAETFPFTNTSTSELLKEIFITQILFLNVLIEEAVQN